VPTLAEIRRALQAHAPRVLEPVAHQAAVAVVLHDAPAGAEMLFIERARHPADPWSGHMAFPGGRVDPGDASPRHAAERETREEVGLDLGGGELLGRLDDVDGAPPGLDRLVVSAFVYSLRPHGDVRPRGTVTLNHEVSDALWVPVPNLIDRARHVPFFWPPGQRATHYPGIVVGDPERQVVWGLTYRFLELLFVALGRPLRPD
jgi:8-oxo-dGTP pyrophosphatase MutT (NUDIX family)